MVSRSRFQISALLATFAFASAGCETLGRPIVECTGVSAEACGVDSGCPADFPARCDTRYCSKESALCPPAGGEVRGADYLIEAAIPEPTPTGSPTP